jgi:hypothetical protein
MTDARIRLLQRKCACGGSGGDCAECTRKRRLLQRSATQEPGTTAVPPIVDHALAGTGRPLPPSVRTVMESRFGHSFARVQVHDGPVAAESARSINAHAYTVGTDVVFAQGKYAPESAEGQRLLAHELTHVVQQSRGTPGRGGPLEIAPPGTAAEREADAAAESPGHRARPRPSPSPVAPAIQRQSAGGEDEKKDQEPAAGGISSGGPKLQLDPEIEAAAMALRMQGLLDPSLIRDSLTRVDLDAIVGSPPPPWVKPPPAGEPQPIVPRGEWRAAPRPAGAGDLLRALLLVPAIDEALTRVRADALDTLRRDWASLSRGEKVAVVTQSALIGGAALIGILSQPDARGFALGLLQNRSLPTGVPGLQLQFNLTDKEQRVEFQLNVGRLLPRDWGFR